MSRLLAIGQLVHGKTKVLYGDMMMCWITSPQLTFIGVQTIATGYSDGYK